MSRPWTSYLLAGVATGVMVVAHYLLDRCIGRASHFLLPFTIAVMIAAWHGGLRSGLFATALNTLVAYFILEPSSSGRIEDTELVRLDMFVVVGVFLSLVCESLHRYRRRAESETRNARSREENLRQSEQRFRLLVEAVRDYAIFMLDFSGHITSWNRGAERINGFASEEIIGQHFSIFYPREAVAQGHPERHLEKAKADGRFEEESWQVRKDGSQFWASVLITPVYDRLGQMCGYSKVTKDLTERKRTEELLHSIVNHVIDGIITIDEHGLIQSFNPAAEKVFGYTPADVVGQNVKMLMPEPYHSQHDGYLADYLRTGPARIIGGGREVVGRRKDGSTFPMDLAVSTFSLNGRRFFTGIIRDVTERKWAEQAVIREISQRRQAEQALLQARDELEQKVQDRTAELGWVNVCLQKSLDEKVVLLKEIHHRVKNNLQIVCSLLDLQSEHTRDNEALEMFKESRGRVKSMAYIHERLYRSQDLAHVNFAEYVRQLADDLYRTYKVSEEEIALDVEVNVPPLPIGIAIPCGLLLNELMSNCLKHAFKDATEGRIRVGLRGGNAEANVLTVADTGAGFPPGFDYRNTTSFGMQLVNTLVEQLNGEIQVKNRRGTEIVVEFPNQR